MAHVGEEGEEMVKEGDGGGRGAEALGWGGGRSIHELIMIALMFGIILLNKQFGNAECIYP